MNFIDNIEILQQSVREKLENHQFSFTDDEKTVLIEKEELNDLFWRQLDSYTSPWSPELLKLFDIMSDGIGADLITPNILYQFDIACINERQYIALYYWSRSQRFEDVSNYFQEKLKDPHYYIKNFDLEVIPMIVEANRYDILLELNNSSQIELSKGTLQAIVEHAPYPLNRLAFWIQEQISKYPDLAQFRDNHPECASIDELLSNCDYPPSTEVMELLEQKIKNGFEVNANSNLEHNFTDFFKCFDKERQRRVVPYLLQHNDWSVIYNIVALAHITDIFSESEVISAIQSGAVHDNDSALSVIARLCKKANFNSYTMIRSIIEAGEVELISSLPKFPSFIPLIKEQIKNHNPKYEKYKNVEQFPLYDSILKDEELVRLIVQEGFIHRFAFYNLRREEATMLANIVIESHQFVQIDGLPISFFQELLKNNQIDYLFFLLSAGEASLDNDDKRSLFQGMTNDEWKLFIEQIQNHPAYQQMLLNDKTISIIILNNPMVLNAFLHFNESSLLNVLNLIDLQNNSQRYYTMDLYQQVRDYFATKYEIPISHLDQVAAYFGPQVIRYMENNAIIQMCKLPEEQFQRLLNLFPKTKFTMQDMTAVYDSLKQYEFGQTHTEITEIFANIRHSLADQTPDYIHLLEELYSIMDAKFQKKLASYYESKKNLLNINESCPAFIDLPNRFQNSPKQTLLWLIEQIKGADENNQKMALEFLHFITNYYIAVKREEYRTTWNMNEELDLPYSYDSKDVERKIADYLLKNNISIGIVDQNQSSDSTLLHYSSYDFIKEQLKKMKPDLDDTLIQDLFSYYSKDGQELHNDSKFIQKHIGDLVQAAKRCLLQIDSYEREIIQDNLDSNDMLKRIYDVPNEEVNLYPLLCNLRVDILQKYVLSDNHEVYDSLSKLMNKYKLHIMPNIIDPLLKQNHIENSQDCSNIASLMSYYYLIYETEKRKLGQAGSTNNITMNLTTALKQADALSSSSSVYGQILTPTDAKLLKANPGPNEARKKIANNKRLNEAIQDTITCYQRQAVTIPTFATMITTDSQKEMYVSVGNFTNPANLTHGERTGACMRIGGAGESLYQFCLHDENGFHIRFESPTGEYVSRVSGFRNGNTVFLNELRYSVQPDMYTNEDVVDACKKIANMLIEKSKDSSYPIENVVVYSAYATENIKAVPLNISTPTVGLKPFYTDISSSAIVLATTAEEDSFVPINFDKNNIPSYMPARERAKQGSHAEIQETINRVHSVRALLEGKDFRYIEPITFDSGFQYGMVSNDWYVYVDDSNQIHEECINVDSRALEELRDARKIVEEKLPQQEITSSYQM